MGRARSRPGEQKSRPAWVDGEWHIFDNCLATQSRTDPARIGLNEDDESFVHFNWVIGVYRHFQNHPGDPVEDRRFVLLLIRLLVDALSEQSATAEPIDVPSLDDLAAGIGRADRRVTYASEEAAEGFAAFRERLDRVLLGPLVEAGAADRIRDRLAPSTAPSPEPPEPLARAGEGGAGLHLQQLQARPGELRHELQALSPP